MRGVLESWGGTSCVGARVSVLDCAAQARVAEPRWGAAGNGLFGLFGEAVVTHRGREPAWFLPARAGDASSLRRPSMPDIL